MKYEKPKVIDLSSQPDKGIGGDCADGSGEANGCSNGNMAGIVCGPVGGTVRFPPGSKYDD